MKHGKNPLYSWFPLYGEKWLFGSTRYELDHPERAIFIDLMALANRDNGFIRANEQFAYTKEHLAGMLHAEVELVESTLLKCIKYGKLEKLENGIYRIKSWDDFSLTDRRKRQISSFPKKRKCISASTEAPLISSSIISLSSNLPLIWEGIKGEDKQSWAVAYPACDIDRELSAMIEWIKANPAKGKKKNYRRFIVNWLARSQERGGGMRSVSPRDAEISRERRVGSSPEKTEAEKSAAREQDRRIKEFVDQQAAKWEPQIEAARTPEERNKLRASANTETQAGIKKIHGYEVQA
ncbi:MAG: phage replisome organizer N-terminal domain-containing protein [Candidatus Omnitrophota bacterium]|jgi:vacuolar-type H+-ATPase subunit H